MRVIGLLVAVLIAILNVSYVRGADPVDDRLESRSDSVIKELRLLAGKGDIEAMNYLGYLLINGTEDVVEQDMGEGLVWLTRAAAAGDVKAASNLGWLYIKGDILEQNVEEGLKWLMKASDAGLPVAQSLLGDMYRDGNGVERDTLVADSLYRAAFERGLGDAGYKLYALNVEKYASLSPEEQVETGKYYYLRGTPSEGVKLFYMASAQGDATALALLGDAYTRAIGVPYDYDLSLKYYAEAAIAGNPSARFVIAELLEIFPDALKNIETVSPLSEDPAYWYEKAAEGGVTDAVSATEMLFKKQIPDNDVN